MELIHVDGLVVQDEPIGDYDKLLTVITESMGKIRISGKGVRSLKSKHMPATQTFCYSSFVLRKSHGYFYISDSSLKEAFFGLRMDLNKLALASYLCDIAADFSVEGMGDADLMKLTLNTLYALANHPHIPLVQLKAAYELRSACIEGFKPNLVACDVCCAFENKQMYLDVMNGRLLCSDCLRTVRKTADIEDEGTAHIYLKLTSPVLKAMQYTVYAPGNRYLFFSLDEKELPRYASVCEKYLLNHIEHGFYSLEFYKSLL